MNKLLTLVLLLVSVNGMASPVNVNTADAATLAAALHGIGLKKAQEIVADREKNGPFKSLEDFNRVKGIGDKTIAKNQADILFDGSSAPIAAPAAAPAAAPKVKAKKVKAVEAAAPVAAAPPAAAPVAAPAAPVAPAAAPAAAAAVKAPVAAAKAAVNAVIPPAAAPAVPAANPLR